MSLPVVLPGSCCRVSGASLAAPPADASHRSRGRGLPAAGGRMPGPQSRLIPALLPGRPLLSLGLLQLVLGCSMVALSFGALSLSNSAPIRNSCPFWAGSSVILSGIIGLTTWRRPMLLLVNLFILLSVVCVLLNLAGFILCCQGAQLVSSVMHCQLAEAGDVCNCCAETPSTKCEEEKMLKIYPGYSCNTMRLLLKKVLFALCALNAVTTAVCLVAAALRYLQIFGARRPCLEEPRPIAEEAEDPQQVPDPDEFVPPAPPPSYFSTFCSYTPRLARRMFGDSVIPLPHIYGARIKGVEVFCPLDPPPPYEAVAGPSNMAGSQEEQIQPADVTRRSTEHHDSRTLGAAAVHPGRRAQRLSQHLRRSSSDPVLLDLSAKVLSCEAATQTEARPETATVTLRRGRGPRRPRPSSLVDYQSYRDTKLLVTRFLEQSSGSLMPEVQELINNIKSVLRSDQEHMEEAVRCASFIDQVITGSEVKCLQPRQTQLEALDGPAQTVPRRKRPGQLHLLSCGDLSTFTWTDVRTATHASSSRGSQASSRASSRTEHERPHSLIGVFRETVL
ncbi:protein FAM189A2 isoform X2 [Denticeps clupeoides]|uniref:protein FAM189A2 isoform X2 n=1 Tax=Denticeps clupeoides TaxID=299321 RepID=UPI0010A355C0|nr:protein FAM189A2 isoform X2 [Denticeps clupeoides]